MEIVKIENREIQVKEYQGQRVVTFDDIDMVHERPNGTAKRNFHQNKDKFIENEDYFFVTVGNAKKYEFRTFEIPTRGMMFLTESGYLMLVKSFTDDLAWKVQRQLVNCYFSMKEKTKTSFALTLKTYQGRPVMTISDISEMLGIHRATVNDYLIHSGISYRLLRGEEIKQFFRENPGENKASTLHVLSYSMVRELLDLLGVWNEHKKKVQAYFGPEEAERSKSGIEKMEHVMFRFKRIFAAKELQAFAHRHSMDTDLRKRLLEIVDEILVREEVYDRVDGEFNPVTPQGHRKEVIYNYLPYIAARGEISISAIDEFAEYIRGQVKALERK